MTREQKVEAYSMLLDGCTMQEVGEKFGVSKQYIQTLFPALGRCGGRGYIYPNISKWMYENRVSGTAFADLLDVSPSVASYWFRGIHEPKKCFIDRVLAVTGMTYEEAFYEDNW